MNTFGEIGFDSNFALGQESVFTNVDLFWTVSFGPKLEMITESGLIMVTEVAQDEMITE
jgi:hypothetical protein